MSVKSSRSILQLGADALQTTSKTSRSQRRTFTKTCQRWRYGPVPKFTNLSTPELTTLLTTVREKLIMPSHLTSLQRELIYKQKNHKDLLVDPVKVNLDGEEFILRPIDRTRDLPRMRESLMKAIGLMQTKGDFDNVPKLLEGLKHAGVQLNTALVGKVIRKLSQAGRQDVVLECARKGSEIGFDLKNYEVVRQVLWTYQMKAMQGGWGEGETAKALRWAEQVFELVELPEHCGKGIKKGEVDPRAQPQSVGVLLELAAVRAEKHLGGKDVDGKVKTYAERLLATGVDVGAPAEKGDIALWLGRTLPVVYGAKVALKVLDPSSTTVEGLQAVYARLLKDASQYRAEYVVPVKGKSQSVELYDELLADSQ